MPSISDTITNVAASSVGWAASSPVVRAALLTRVAEALDANVESLVRICLCGDAFDESEISR